MLFFAGMASAAHCALADAAPPPQLTATTNARLMADLDTGQPGMEKVRAAIEQNDLIATEQAYLEYRRTASTAKWKVNPSDEPAKAVETHDLLGDETCAHHIHNLWYAFAPKVFDVGADFNWEFNPLPRTDPNYSINWPACVIARTQFWEQLSNAYWKTHDEKYAREWVAELQSFAAKVPVDFDHRDSQKYLWSTLSAANRMFESWPIAYAHFLSSPSMTPEANWLYAKEVRDHGLLLREGLSNPKRSGNWVTAECCGLYTLSTLFPEFRESADWRQFAMDRYTVELNRLVLPDGFGAELTPGYATSTIEQFSVPVQLAELNHQPVPEDFRQKLIAMYRALVSMMDPSGNIPCTNDSWQLNGRKLAAIGLKLFDDPLVRWTASGGAEGTPPADSTMLPVAGFYAMRSGWKPDDFYLFFRGGPMGLDHGHQEDLKIMLSSWHQPLLYDPGTYDYGQSPFRGYVVGTASHNTVIVDGKWQHRAEEMPSTQPTGNPWVTTPLFDYAAATYDGGYQQSEYRAVQFAPFRWVGELDKSVSHTRRVLFLKPYCAIIVDTLDGTGNHTFDALFHLNAPAARIDSASQAVFSQREGDAQLALFPLEKDHLAVDIAQGQQNPILGWDTDQHKPIPTVRFRKQQDAPAIFATVLYPYQNAEPEVAGSAISAGDGAWGESITTPREKADVVIIKDGSARPIAFHSALTGASVKAHAEGILVRRPAGSSGIDVGGWGLHDYNDGSIAFTSEDAISVAFTGGEHPTFFNAGPEPVQVTFTRPLQEKITLAPQTWTDLDGKPAAPPSLFALATSPN
jgi:hypothetical protein